MSSPLFQPSPNSTLPQDQSPSPTGAPPHPDSNRPGSPPRSPSRKASFELRYVLIVVPILLLLAGGGAAWFYWLGPQQHRKDIVTYTVHRENLQLRISERGTLESANNFEVVCRVKAGTRGATKINSVIDNGKAVKRDHEYDAFVAQSAVGLISHGAVSPFDSLVWMPVQPARDPRDRLVDLDDSALQEQLNAQAIVRDQAEANKTTAEETYLITLSQNDADIKTAETTLELAKIDLERYLKGDYPQQLKDVDGRITMARSDLDTWKGRIAWVDRMAKQGYYTPTQALSERLRLESAEIALKKVEEEKRVLNDYTYRRTHKELESKLEDAGRTLSRVREQAKSKEKQARADKIAKQSIYAQEVARFREFLEEIEKCVIRAPQDGLVVYYIPEQTRLGSGTQQSTIAQGEPAQFGQKMMTIPDLNHMVVNARIHEALINHVKEGQEVDIRIESLPGKTLKGKVKQVATIAAQQDWFAPDVKVYQVSIGIEGSVPGLKPGMSATVTIKTYLKVENALAVPVQAVIPPKERGKKPTCLVKTSTSAEEREVVLGMNNDTLVEIKDGLEEGEEVILNPTAFLNPNKDKGKGDAKNGDPAGGKKPASGGYR